MAEEGEHSGAHGVLDITYGGSDAGIIIVAIQRIE